MTDPERLDLAKRRELSELIGDAIRVYTGNFATLFAIAAAIVVPVQLIVSGIGLEELTSGYRSEPTTAELIPTLVSFLVIAPLIAAATIGVLRDLDKGEQPRFGRSLQLGLDAFAPVFLAVILASIGIAAGLALFIVPGVYIAVRLVFVAQAVVIDEKRGPDALRATWELTRGSWWRVFATILTANLIAFVPAALVLLPLEALASSADREAIVLAGKILTETLTAPFVALISTLLFFDLRARRGPQAERLF